jgi:hypothetical protein
MAFRVLDFSDGFTSSTVPSAGGLNVSSLLVYANDAAFVTANGPAGNGDIYYNSTLNVVRYYDGNLAAWTSVVSKDGAETLTNKTITGAGNTISGLLHGTQVDNPSSGVHGVTGSVVGTSDSQTLTNKTIDDSVNTLTVRAASVDSGASTSGDVLTSDGAGNASWQAVSAASFTNYAIYANDAAFVTANGTAQAGDAYYNSTTNKVRYYNGTVWVNQVGDTETQTLTNKTIAYGSNTITVSEAEVDSGVATAGKVLTADGAGNATWETGGGGVGLNFIDNWDFEGGASGWTMYADAAGVKPVDGTGGTPTSTFTVSGTSPLDGTQSLIINHPASNVQGEGISYDFTIDNAYKNAPMSVQFNYQIASGTFVSGSASDVRVWLYDVTNSVLIQPSTYTIDGGGSAPHRFYGVFQPTLGNSTSFRLILHFATTATAAFGLKVDNFQVGPTSNAKSELPVLAASASGSVASSASGATIVFPNVDFDPDSLYSAGQFTAPSAGKYELRSFGVAATGAVNFAAYLNGTLYKALGTADNTNGSYSGSVIVDAAEGDLIDLRSTNAATGGLDSTSWIQFNKLDSSSIVASQKSEVYLTNGNGYGSTNTNIRRYSTIQSQVGDDITYVDSSTLGGSFTLNSAGVYEITVVDSYSGSSSQIGASKNSSQLTTAIDSINASDRLFFTNTSAAGFFNSGSAAFVANAGDVIRVHGGNNLNDDTSAISSVRIVKVQSIDGSAFAPTQNEVYLTGGNGHGSSGTTTRCFTTLVKQTGTDIVYTADTTNGDYFTVGASGMYAFYWADTSTTPMTAGFTNNSNQLNQGYTNALNDAFRLGGSGVISPVAGQLSTLGLTCHLDEGDVVRCQSDSATFPDGTNVLVSFRMVRLA